MVKRMQGDLESMRKRQNGMQQSLEQKPDVKELKRIEDSLRLQLSQSMAQEHHKAETQVNRLKLELATAIEKLGNCEDECKVLTL